MGGYRIGRRADTPHTTSRVLATTVDATDLRDGNLTASQAPEPIDSSTPIIQRVASEPLTRVGASSSPCLRFSALFCCAAGGWLVVEWWPVKTCYRRVVVVDVDVKAGSRRVAIGGPRTTAAALDVMPGLSRV